MLTRPILQRAAAAATNRYFRILATNPWESGSRANWKSGISRSNALLVNTFSSARKKKRPLSTLPERRTMSTATSAANTEDWTTQVATAVTEQAQLDVWSVENSTVGILLHHSGNGSLFDMDELEDVCRYMSMDVSKQVPRSVTANERSILATVCNRKLGPPSIDVGIADGAERAILSMAAANDLDVVEMDTIAVKKLALVAKYFVALTKSNVL